VLQCVAVAVCCSVLQLPCVAVCCSCRVLQCVAACCSARTGAANKHSHSQGRVNGAGAEYYNVFQCYTCVADEGRRSKQTC